MIDFRVGTPLEEDGGVGGRPVDGLEGVTVKETASSRGLRNMSYTAINQSESHYQSLTVRCTGNGGGGGTLRDRGLGYDTNIHT